MPKPSPRPLPALPRPGLAEKPPALPKAALPSALPNADPIPLPDALIPMPADAGLRPADPGWGIRAPPRPERGVPPTDPGRGEPARGVPAAEPGLDLMLPAEAPNWEEGKSGIIIQKWFVVVGCTSSSWFKRN